jgi:D-alanyl-D-alanine carboxypeptidase
VLPQGFLFAPGEGWSYSNIGYMLLRMALEKVTGKSYRQCVNDLVATPLGLRDTFAAETIQDWSTCVPGFGSEVDREGKTIDVRDVYHPGWCAPGVVVSTAEETTLIFDALFTGKLLRPQTLERMLTLVRVPGNHPPAVSPSCGMGILGDPDSPLGACYGHGGGGPGYNLNATVMLSSKLGRVAIAVFANTSSGASAQQIEMKLIQHLLSGSQPLL